MSLYGLLAEGMVQNKGGEGGFPDQMIRNKDVSSHSSLRLKICLATPRFRLEVVLSTSY